MAADGINGQRSRNHASRQRVRLLLVVVALIGFCPSGICNEGGSSIGFSIHHRLSDPVRAMFSDEYLPVKGTVDYFSAMVERDRIHGRRLASNSTKATPLTFVAGNTTYRFPVLGFLYYANVSIGTPGLDFLVALDTGSDISWVPCDCISCVTSFKTSSGELKFNSYELNASSTGKQVPCNSPLCDLTDSCTVPSQCPYKIDYLSANTSSSGYLVEDVIHLTTDDYNDSRLVDANITFGCGQRQTGGFLKGGAPNGLFGLGMEQISVPSTLASQNITLNSFSMCFGPGGIGRISFGDGGSSDQAQTPFTLLQQYQTYFISISQIAVGMNASRVNVEALFDTGSSFVVFTDPVYTIITEAFHSQVQDKRVTDIPDNPFEFCYEMSSCSSEPKTPSINLTMSSGAVYNVIKPTLLLLATDQSCFYCFGVTKGDQINIIGENFMYGHRIVFDREKMVLGWKESECDYAVNTTIADPIFDSPTVPANIDTSGASTLAVMADKLGYFKHWPFAILLLAI